MSRSQKPRTHCKHGHPYTPENTYTYPASTKRQRRRCIACRREYDRVRYDEERRDPRTATERAA